ncbi:MAG: hypothetical protein ACJAYU_000568 [Bradymonadia bacterium]|jgi:hypothetical protein
MLLTDTSVNYAASSTGNQDTAGTTDTGSPGDTGSPDDNGSPRDTAITPDIDPRSECEDFCFDVDFLNTCVGEETVTCDDTLCRSVTAQCRVCVADAVCIGQLDCIDSCDEFYCTLFPWDCEEQTSCDELSRCCEQIEAEFDRDTCWETVAEGEAAPFDTGDFVCSGSLFSYQSNGDCDCDCESLVECR